MNLQKLLPAKLGAEPKKLAVLAALLVAAGIAYWVSSAPSGDAAATPTTAAPSRTPAAVPIEAPPAPPRPAAKGDSVSGARGNAIADFKPTLKLAEGMDVSRIDPALHLDLLARVRNAEAGGGSRSLFEFSQPPPPPPPKVKPIVPGPVAAATPAPEAPKGPPEPPKPPPPPPIALKFYGYAGTSRGGARRAFFLDGDDILVAGENETLKNRYKIIRIGVNSAVLEDLNNKNQQTLPLAAEL